MEDIVLQKEFAEFCEWLESPIENEEYKPTYCPHHPEIEYKPQYNTQNEIFHWYCPECSDGLAMQENIKRLCPPMVEEDGSKKKTSANYRYEVRSLEMLIKSIYKNSNKYICSINMERVYYFSNYDKQTLIDKIIDFYPEYVKRRQAYLKKKQFKVGWSEYGKYIGAKMKPTGKVWVALSRYVNEDGQCEMIYIGTYKHKQQALNAQREFLISKGVEI
jgi:hypothetical protein